MDLSLGTNSGLETVLTLAPDLRVIFCWSLDGPFSSLGLEYPYLQNHGADMGIIALVFPQRQHKWVPVSHLQKDQVGELALCSIQGQGQGPNSSGLV
jgi:hypothetical protein